MRVNIFRIETPDVAAMKEKLKASNMQVIHTEQQDGWHGEFYFSKSPAPSKVSWAKIYAPYFTTEPKNRNHYAAYVFTKGNLCYAISYGKTHFYLRPYCDFDFGVEVAKRIANDADTRLTASRRFQGNRKKDIRSFANNTRLDIESGESVDYIQAAVAKSHQATFGKSGKFAASVQLSPKIDPPSLGKFLSALTAEVTKPERFKLPRTTIVTDKDEIAKFDQLLIKELTAAVGTSEFTNNNYDLYGVDFVFGSEGNFTLRCPGKKSVDVEQLTMKELKDYIKDQKLAKADILRVKIDHNDDDGPGWSEGIKEAVDFIADKERVLLTGGRWMRFNQDYLDFLDEYIRGISVEAVEPEFAVITTGEPEFNVSAAIKSAGYAVADKDFSIFKTRSSTPIEAWDLSKGSRVYAVKFGSAQKLGYVCDQATNVLELLRNSAGVKEVPNFDSYCLWLGYRAQTPLTDIASTGSIILKQKVDRWARKCRELGIEPVIKISQRKINGVDE